MADTDTFTPLAAPFGMRSLEGSPGISRSRLWIYGSFGLPLAVLGYPLGVWLPRAYDTYIGIDTFAVGAVISIAALFDERD